jgi:hypothetical protein
METVMNEIIRADTAVGAPGKLNLFEQLAAAVAYTPFEGELLKFSKGEYLAPNDELIEVGTACIAHMPGLHVGWQKWENGKPVQQEIGVVAEGYRPPNRSDLGNTDPSAWEVNASRAIRGRRRCIFR